MKTEEIIDILKDMGTINKRIRKFKTELELKLLLMGNKKMILNDGLEYYKLEHLKNVLAIKLKEARNEYDVLNNKVMGNIVKKDIFELVNHYLEFYKVINMKKNNFTKAEQGQVDNYMESIFFQIENYPNSLNIVDAITDKVNYDLTIGSVRNEILNSNNEKDQDVLTLLVDKTKKFNNETTSFIKNIKEEMNYIDLLDLIVILNVKSTLLYFDEEVDTKIVDEVNSQKNKLIYEASALKGDNQDFSDIERSINYLEEKQNKGLTESYKLETYKKFIKFHEKRVGNVKEKKY